MAEGNKGGAGRETSKPVSGGGGRRISGPVARTIIDEPRADVLAASVPAAAAGPRPPPTGDTEPASSTPGRRVSRPGPRTVIEEAPPAGALAEGSSKPALADPPDESAALRSRGPSSLTQIDEAPAGRGASADREVEASRRSDGSQYRPGDFIYQYELIRELGRGGMGQVFLARDLRLGRKVAIKLLVKISDTFTERFLVEARTTAQCSHENIVIIHDVNEHRGRPFMVLEYLDGEPLSELLGAPLPPLRAVEIMIPVVRALVCAHDVLIVHRDLKPDNIFVQRSGAIKVVDFGIAKILADEAARSSDSLRGVEGFPEMGGFSMTLAGGIVGTMPYMSPEQWGAGSVDHRTDIWAVGLILYEMVSGIHPLGHLNSQELMSVAALADRPMPRISTATKGLPRELEQVIDRCLAKRKEERWDSARDLLAALEGIARRSHGRQLASDECPFPGLTAFQEADAGRFFGRRRDATRAVARIRDRPLVGIVGPSGVGKSSFVRAGVVPALKASETWETFIVRPGRSPLAPLAGLLQSVEVGSSAPGSAAADDGAPDAREVGAREERVARLRAEPGMLGTALRERARRQGSSILLFVDQFEELYTLVADEAERRAFIACIRALADDVAAPLRVVISMRSDFLDRVVEDAAFLDDLTRGLIFLRPPDRAGLREAITQPLELSGYRFENDAMVERMLDDLADSAGALPLLQFAGAKLWDTRDVERQLIPQESFAAMGGIAGVLSSHADEVLGGLSPREQQLCRAIFRRLVTVEGTRAIVDIEELCATSKTPEDVRRVVDYLAEGRLLVVQTRLDGDGPAVEIVHESLISEWPTLRHWLETDHEDAAFLEQLRHAAKQWEARSRAPGLLWRGEAAQEAQRWQRRYSGELPPREQAYLEAVDSLAARAGRRRRMLLTGVIGGLVVLVAAAAVGLVLIRSAERTARASEARARKNEALAKRNAYLARQSAALARKNERLAREAADQVKQQLAVIQSEKRQRSAAERAKDQATARAQQGEKALARTQEQLNLSYDQLKEALRRARAARQRAEAASSAATAAAEREKRAADRVRRLAEAERRAKTRLEQLLARERERVRRLIIEKRKITTTLR